MKSAADNRLAALRETHWPKEHTWCWAGGGETNKAWFAAPPTLPLLLCMMREKTISRGKSDPSTAYVERLLANAGNSGGDGRAGHQAFGCGYRGARGVRTCHERMAILERAGFIRTNSPSTRHGLGFDRSLGEHVCAHPPGSGSSVAGSFRAAASKADTSTAH